MPSRNGAPNKQGTSRKKGAAGSWAGRSNDRKRNERALELVLLNGSSEADLDVIRRYKSIDIGKVVSRVRLLHEEHCNLKSIDDVAAVLRNMHTSTRQYFKEVESVLRIILVMPVPSCEAERSFSALKD
ncbi:hypothetical protein HPB48_001451 [Haemaphysalis longicornis]|uniref:HAT C-terminal dimerisation domain-containing protein n=1 Tax=Haemaphysalis longicornis TaxID=44386 RepID=A0A9J6F7A4_HAELO|nr:hypothetical protein HPB48_001451 [Haemaphysalis longicornis]